MKLNSGKAFNMSLAALISLSAAAGETTDWVKSGETRGNITGGAGVAALAIGVGAGAHAFNQSAKADHASESPDQAAYNVEKNATSPMRREYYELHERVSALEKDLQREKAHPTHESSAQTIEKEIHQLKTEQRIIQSKMNEAHAYLTNGAKGTLLTQEQRTHLDSFAQAYRKEVSKALELKRKSNKLAVKGASAIGAGLVGIEVVPLLTELALSRVSQKQEEKYTIRTQKAQASGAISQTERGNDESVNKAVNGVSAR